MNRFLPMRILKLVIVIGAALIASLQAAAASSSFDADHLHVQFIVPASQLNPGQTSDAGFYFKLEPGWHVYWLNAGDSGEPPKVKWTLPEGVSAGSLKFPAPKRLPLGPLMDFGYEDEVLFPLTLSVSNAAKPGPVALDAKINWLVCREVCIPGKADLEADRAIPTGATEITPVTPDRDIFNRLANRLPQPLPASDKLGFTPAPTGFRLTFETGQRESEAIFFPADQEILDNPSPQKLTPTAQGFTLDLKKDANLAANPKELRGVLELSRGRAYEIAAMPGPPAPPIAPRPQSGSPSTGFATAGMEQLKQAPPPPAFDIGALGRTAALAFLGGLILNLMPCVFPVLFLKGLALVNSGNEERHKLRAHGFVYTAGIVISFWALVAVLLGLRAAGARLGWGFQFQSPVFLALMASLLFFLGLSLAGQFEVGLTLTSAGGSLAAKQGYTGSFFTGVLAVIVATPCTAPFMGAAIGYALAQPPAVTFAVFTALALGLAAPYVALTLQPAWTRLLPRPGAWMDVLKQAVSVPIFGTVIWMAWVLANAYGAAVLAALLVSFLLLAIAGWFLGRWPAKRWAAGMAAVIVLGVIALSAFSAKAFVSPSFNPRNVLAVQMAPGTYWGTWSEEAQSRYQADGQPVFVDFTAKWCLSCQVNERVALEQPDVMKAFADAHVALLKADWTQQDENIARALASFGRNGVPAYALYVPGEASPRLLPEVLTPGIVTGALKSLPRTAARTNTSTVSHP
jgi:thiol:disulfide interchange protein DsbD